MVVLGYALSLIIAKYILPSNKIITTPLARPSFHLPNLNLVINPTPSSPIPSPSAPSTIPVKYKPLPTTDQTPWGISKQIAPDTWTMKIAMDPTMATPQDILAALNSYRQRHGSQPLTWDSKLADFAQTRADYLNSIHATDNHQGFIDFLDNQNGYQKLGFTALGENISTGFRLIGVHLIEWIFAGDKPHNDNQLDNRWNYVGIGVHATAVSIIFGTGKN